MQKTQHKAMGGGEEEEVKLIRYQIGFILVEKAQRKQDDRQLQS